VATTPLAFSGAGVTYDADMTARRHLHNQWSMVTGDLGAEWRPNTDSLLFIKASKGYKAGAINTGFSGTPYANAEKAYVGEAGWKQTWGDSGLTTNLAGFYYLYKDMQASVTEVQNPGVAGQERSVGVLKSIPEATSAGIELESNWNPIEPLNIGLTYSYLTTEITDGGGTYIDSSRDQRCLNSSNAVVACSTITSGTLNFVDPLSRIKLEGHDLPQSPHNKVALNISYRFTFADGSTLLPNINYFWRDKFYDTITNATTEQAPTQQQVDLRVTWKSSEGRFALVGFVRNLMDEEQNTSVAANTFRTADNGRYQTFSYAPPRMIGAELQFHWK